MVFCMFYLAMLVFSFGLTGWFILVVYTVLRSWFANLTKQDRLGDYLTTYYCFEAGLRSMPAMTRFCRLGEQTTDLKVELWG